MTFEIGDLVEYEYLAYSLGVVVTIDELDNGDTEIKVFWLDDNMRNSTSWHDSYFLRKKFS